MRTFKYELLEVIRNRWSARAFSNQRVKKDDIYALIEAASYAPSSMNEQPWRFILGYENDVLLKLRDSLTSSNQEWANQAPVLICLISHRFHARNGKENKYNVFDSGSAFAFLSLEATNRGLIAHPMGGFDKEKIRESFNISDEYDIVLMIAVGYLGDKSLLSESNQLREKPGSRKSFEENIIVE